MKRIFAMCLALIMVLFVFASCGKKVDNPIDESDTGETPNESDVIVTPGIETPPATEAPKETDPPVVVTQEYVEFGSYPQTLVNNEDVIKALEEAAGELPTASAAGKWQSYRYLSAGEKSDFMFYIDLEHEGAKYRGVYMLEYRSYDPTVAVSTDLTFQDDNGYEVNKAYWFKYEPIKWRILEDKEGNALIFAETILDAQPFAVAQSCDYKASDIRDWLNTSFYETAFNAAQKELIVTTKVANGADTTNDMMNVNVCDDTDDDVFLLSYADVLNTAYKFTSSSDLVKPVTDYSAAQGLFVKADAGQWWLRSPDGVDAARVSRVKPEGDVGVNKTHILSVGVVPALTLNIKDIAASAESAEN